MLIYNLSNKYINFKSKLLTIKNKLLLLLSIIDYKEIKVIKKTTKVKYYKTKKDRITASLVVNDKQNDGKDWVYFFAPKLGIDGTLSSAHIKIR